MWSIHKNSDWGCRCCGTGGTGGGNPHQLWDVWGIRKTDECVDLKVAKDCHRQCDSERQTCHDRCNIYHFRERYWDSRSGCECLGSQSDDSSSWGSSSSSYQYDGFRGYYDANDDPEVVVCRPCPRGSYCKESGHTLATLPLEPGYWRTSNQSSELRRCPDASSFPPFDKTACKNENGVVCKPWTTGPYCRVCNVTDGSRYFDSGQSECVECGDTVATAATSLAALAGIAVAVLLLLCWCGWRHRSLRFMGYQTLQKIRAPLKQIVAFFQVRKLLR
jgi:hypothetical protein